jgi:hypothetical protein
LLIAGTGMQGRARSRTSGVKSFASSSERCTDRRRLSGCCRM